MEWFCTPWSTLAGLTLVLSVTGACGGDKPPAKSPVGGETEGKGGPAEVGKAAPDLSFQTVNGKGQVTLESLQGKIAVVDFWATWCGPCKQSFPKLEELSKQNSGKVVVVGVSVDDTSVGVADFAKTNGATFAIGWDDGHSIANRWKVDSMPTTYVLDASGKIRYIHAGYHEREAEVIAKELATLTSESSSGPSKTEVASAPAKEPSSDSPPPPKEGDKAADSPGTNADAASETPSTTAKPKKAGKGGKGGKPGAKKVPSKKAAPKKPTP